MIGILKSLGMTARAVFRKPVMIQYPTVHRAIANRDRAFPILIWDEEKDEPFCTDLYTTNTSAAAPAADVAASQTFVPGKS